jgi:predicted secreted hydrolase
MKGNCGLRIADCGFIYQFRIEDWLKPTGESRLILRTSRGGLQTSGFHIRNRQSAIRCLLPSALRSVLASFLVFAILGPFTCGSFESKSAQTTSPASSAPTAGGTVNSEGWREAAAGYQFRFPADHGSHPEYRVEWWYYTGNLETEGGRRFGYQLTFFRTGVVPLQKNPSRWAVRDLFMAHFAISDIRSRSFRSFERVNRAGIGWAGADPSSYRVWNEQWEATLEGTNHRLTADDGEFALDLKLAPRKPEVIHGLNSISQKGPAAGNASHYYSLSRLETTGRIVVEGESFEVNGWSWMDHEFGTSFLEQEQTGWDWFSIQLEDGRELMLFELRRADGSIDPRSSGTLIDSDGRSSHIDFREFTLKPSNGWLSDASGATYPTTWAIDLPAYGISLTAKSAFVNQELSTSESTGVTYWEGSIEVEGNSAGRPLRGRGYLEMTGYSGQSMGAILK